MNEIILRIPLDELVSRLKAELLPAITQQQPQETKEEEFLTAKQVSKLLGVSLVTLHKWKKDGKIKFHRFGSRIRMIKQLTDIANNGDGKKNVIDMNKWK